MKHYYRTKDGYISELAEPTYWAHYVKLSTKMGKELYREQCKQMLLESIPIGSTIYTLVTKVAASGMSRHIRVLYVRKGEIWDLSFFAARVLDWSESDQGVRVSGCGMDMGFHLVSSLSHALFWNEKGLAQTWL